MKGSSVRMSGEKGLVDLMAGAPKYPDAVEAALENKNLLNINLRNILLHINSLH